MVRMSRMDAVEEAANLTQDVKTIAFEHGGCGMCKQRMSILEDSMKMEDVKTKDVKTELL